MGFYDFWLICGLIGAGMHVKYAWLTFHEERKDGGGVMEALSWVTFWFVFFLILSLAEGPLALGFFIANDLSSIETKVTPRDEVNEIKPGD